ncbi:TBC1 domain family member 16-like isoform X1 [Mizuhopecten yessoensis]|uniref:TBC1 domain family member 16-like isoform X1 n=1 Tax=Mizuhopecten yessoensis TaxID=6573 RepID=UPI000B45DA4A|nr:TBC1 domain family member 16-like isoform X1 [Mizuhopecten yessoensis]
MADNNERPGSVDESFEFINYPEDDAAEKKGQGPDHFKSRNSEYGWLNDGESSRGNPVTKEKFEQMFDEDGRIVDEHSLRKAVFMGGVDLSIRRKVWQFLFGLYPCTSTAREREEILLDYIMKYHEQKSRWKTMLVLDSKPGATPLEQGLIGRYQVEDPTNQLQSPTTPPHGIMSPLELLSRNEDAARMSVDQPDFSILSKNFANIDVSTPEMQQKIDFVKIQSQVFVNRQKVDVKDLWTHIRVIDKDVPRTDRDQEYFRGARNPHLTVLRDILVTFSAFHPVIGYAQGMNDILARFLVVFDSEVEAYWCFRNYLDHIQEEFTEEGMMKKIDLVVMLLREMDTELLDHLNKHDLGDLMFCHRWLLLGFKREFSFADSLRCFEILSSHHLELFSMEAENARRKEVMKEFENFAYIFPGGGTRSEHLAVRMDYTFELFMCLALLMDCRTELLKCIDSAMVFGTINSLKINLEETLTKAAKLFYKYCKKTVEESFLMIDPPKTSTSKR